MKKNRSLKIVLILTLLSIPAMFTLLMPGFYEPHDLHHLADIHQMLQALLSGQIPPRLGPDFTFSYGYPLFNFYYLLPFYIGAFWYALFASLTASFKFVFLISVALSVYGMYLFLREFVGRFPAIVGSILFLYTPYRAVQIYVRGAMGEAFALALLPFVLWGVVRLIKKPKTRRLTLGVSLIFALFIISHNYLWAIILPFVVLLILLLMKVEQSKSWPRLLMTGLISIGLTTYWWLPALVESKLVSSVTPFPLIDHFPFIKQLLIPSWGYGSSVWGPGDEISFQVGTVNLLVVIVSISLLVFYRRLFKNRKVYLITLWALVGFFVSLFMMNIRSYFIWKLIPFHDFIQFPWRLLLLTTLFTSILAAVIVHILPKKLAKTAGFIIVGASLVLTTQYFRPSKVVFKGDEDYLKRFFESTTYSEDYLLLPNWVDERPSRPPLSKFEAEGAKISDIEEISPVYYRAEIDAEKLTTISFHSYYFPGWFAKIDGKNAEIKPGKPYGQIELIVPEGNHQVEFYWQETPLRKFSDYISLLSLLVLGSLFVKKKQSNNAKKQK